MNLVRVVLVRFAQAPRQGNDFAGDLGGVRVDTLGSLGDDTGALTIVLAGSTSLKRRPKLAGGRLVVVPTTERERCERMLESMANFISVSERSRRSIASPIPCVAFIPVNEEERQWLAATDGILEQNELRDIPTAASAVPFTDEITAGLIDRLDGVALLAEALAHEHPTGQLHEHFRLLERSFSRPARLLAAPLLDFLHERFGYTAAELEAWIALRDSVSHADAREIFALDADVRPVLWRVEQATYDALFNKAIWRDRSPARREVWMPDGWTSSPEGDVKARLGSTGSLMSRLLDQFGVYPADMQTLSALPEGWWSPSAAARSRDIPFEVVEI
jgi:hypothetical protein